MLPRFFFFLIFILFTFGQLQQLPAQQITRTTLAERADGLGFVLRFHATARIDSFKIVQSSAELVQVAMYRNNLRIPAETAQMRSPVSSVTFHPIPGGTGIDIRLAKDTRYLSRIYRDRDTNDILVGLTSVSRRDIDNFTRGFSPVDWSKLQPQPQPVPNQPAPAEPEITEPDLLDMGEDAPRSGIRFRTVVIDAGHGGRDPGAIGFSGSYEKTIALAVAKKLGDYIEQYLPELNVVYTRKNDVFIDLDERGRIANRAQGDLFISIHTNSHNTRQPHGAEIYFLGMNRTKEAFEVMKRENSVIEFQDNAQVQELTQEQLLIYELSNSGYMASSQRFAELLERQFAERARRRSRGVKQAGLIVLWNASMPGVLVELGFISNPEEERFMNSDYGQAILASAIFRAVRDYKQLIERGNQRRASSE